jgi:hypothetical protein
VRKVERALRLVEEEELEALARLEAAVDEKVCELRDVEALRRGRSLLEDLEALDHLVDFLCRGGD